MRGFGNVLSLTSHCKIRAETGMFLFHSTDERGILLGHLYTVKFSRNLDAIAGRRKNRYGALLMYVTPLVLGFLQSPVWCPQRLLSFYGAIHIPAHSFWSPHSARSLSWCPKSLWSSQPFGLLLQFSSLLEKQEGNQHCCLSFCSSSAPSGGSQCLQSPSISIPVLPASFVCLLGHSKAFGTFSINPSLLLMALSTLHFFLRVPTDAPQGYPSTFWCPPLLKSSHLIWYPHKPSMDLTPKNAHGAALV